MRFVEEEKKKKFCLTIEFDIFSLQDPEDSNAAQRPSSRMSKGGSIFKVNTQTRSFSVGEEESRYGTTLINTEEEEKEPELEYNEWNGGKT